MSHPSHDLDGHDAEDVPRIIGSTQKVKPSVRNDLTIPSPVRQALSGWKKVELGTEIACPFGFISAIKNSGMLIDEWAAEVLKSRSFTVSSDKASLDLARISVKEFGFHHGVQFHTILEEASGHGLAPCPAEVGPQLRLQYFDQPRHEKLTVVMEPIMTTTGGHLRVFSLWHLDGMRQLRTSSGCPSSRFSADEILLFTYRKNS